MEKKKSKNQDEHLQEQQTPIMDGDSRPDQIVDHSPAEVIKASKEKKAAEFTVNRKRDVNSLEDYKDAK